MHFRTVNGELCIIKIQTSGLRLSWPKLGADFDFPALVKGVLGTRLWMPEVDACRGKATTCTKTKNSHHRQTRWSPTTTPRVSSGLSWG